LKLWQGGKKFSAVKKSFWQEVLVKKPLFSENLKTKLHHNLFCWKFATFS